MVARLGIPIDHVLDRLPGEELTRLVAAANRARAMDMLLTRIAMYADDRAFAKVRQAFDGAPPVQAKPTTPPEDEDHSEFLTQVREHFAKGKS